MRKLFYSVFLAIYMSVCEICGRNREREFEWGKSERERETEGQRD